MAQLDLNDFIAFLEATPDKDYIFSDAYGCAFTMYQKDRGLWTDKVWMGDQIARSFGDTYPGFVENAINRSNTYGRLADKLREFQARRG